MAAKPVGSTVRLRIDSWEEGDKPGVGDCLRTSRGRLYEIMEVRGRQLTCLVIDDSYRLREGAKVYSWAWTPRS